VDAKISHVLSVDQVIEDIFVLDEILMLERLNPRKLEENLLNVKQQLDPLKFQLLSKQIQMRQ
jgi:hypothetical protein